MQVEIQIQHIDSRFVEQPELGLTLFIAELTCLGVLTRSFTPS